MKHIFLLIALLLSSHSFADVLNSSDNVFVCLKKKTNIYQPKSYSMFLIDKSRNLAYYENSSGGQETQKLLSLTVNKGVLTAKHNSGTAETLTVNYSTGIGTWVENAYPDNVQTYPNCMSFSNYNINQLRAWMHQLGL